MVVGDRVVHACIDFRGTDLVTSGHGHGYLDRDIHRPDGIHCAHENSVGVQEPRGTRFGINVEL